MPPFQVFVSLWVILYIFYFIYLLHIFTFNIYLDTFLYRFKNIFIEYRYYTRYFILGFGFCRLYQNFHWAQQFIFQNIIFNVLQCNNVGKYINCGRTGENVGRVKIQSDLARRKKSLLLSLSFAWKNICG